MSDKKKRELTDLKTEAEIRRTELHTELLELQVKNDESALSKYFWVWMALAILAGAYIGADLGGMI